MLNIGVFGSGRGSNFQAIVDAIARGDLPNATIAVVVSNNSPAGMLSIARANSLPAIHLSMNQFAGEEEFVRAQLEALRAHGVNCIVLAGYMKKLHPRIIAAYRNSILNIHPALLPAFGGQGMFGMRVHEAVISSGSPVSGATVHLVDEEYDHGSILLQKSVPVDRGETPESLAAKVLRIEHELYPEALRLIAEGKIPIGSPPGNTVIKS
jgi:phosphoribosylglycinamide formyltransferase-1